MREYAVLARYYDYLHAELSADIPFILALAEKAQGEIIEWGCGTGRVLLPLAQAGYAVTGVDLSAEMLDVARSHLTKANLQDKVSLMMGNFAQIDLPENHYKLILLSYNTLMHLPSLQWGGLLKRAARLLAPDGVIFLDVANPLWLTMAEDQPNYELEREFVDEQTGARVEQWSRYRHDFHDQQLQVDWRFVSADGQEALQMIYHYEHPHLLYDLVEGAGLQVEGIFGNYEGQAVDEETERLLLLARKP